MLFEGAVASLAAPAAVVVLVVLAIVFARASSASPSAASPSLSGSRRRREGSEDTDSVQSASSSSLSSSDGLQLRRSMRRKVEFVDESELQPLSHSKVQARPSLRRLERFQKIADIGTRVRAKMLAACYPSAPDSAILALLRTKMQASQPPVSSASDSAPQSSAGTYAEASWRVLVNAAHDMLRLEQLHTAYPTLYDALSLMDEAELQECTTHGDLELIAQWQEHRDEGECAGGENVRERVRERVPITKDTLVLAACITARRVAKSRHTDELEAVAMVLPWSPLTCDYLRSFTVKSSREWLQFLGVESEFSSMTCQNVTGCDDIRLDFPALAHALTHMTVKELAAKTTTEDLRRFPSDHDSVKLAFLVSAARRALRSIKSSSNNGVFSLRSSLNNAARGVFDRSSECAVEWGVVVDKVYAQTCVLVDEERERERAERRSLRSEALSMGGMHSDEEDEDVVA